MVAKKKNKAEFINPPINEREQGIDKYTKRIEWLTFAQKHNLILDPSTGCRNHLESYCDLRACPCDPLRKSCPCDKVLEEVATNGVCKCHLFWKDYPTVLAYYERTKP